MGIMTMMLSALHSFLAVGGRTLRVFLVAGAFVSLLAIGCGSSPSQNSAATSSATSTPESTAPSDLPATVNPPTATSTSGDAPTTIPPTEEIRTFVGSSAPDFPFKLFQGEDTLGDNELDLSDIIGQPIVLNFWARLCGPCWSEMPELQEFYEENGDKLKLLGIDVGQFTGLGSPKDAGRLLDSLGVTYPAGYTDDASVVSKYRIRAMPTTVFIDSSGKVFRTWTGAIDRQQLDSIVAEMLNQD